MNEDAYLDDYWESRYESINGGPVWTSSDIDEWYGADIEDFMDDWIED